MLSGRNASVMIIGPQARPEPLRLKAERHPIARVRSGRSPIQSLHWSLFALLRTRRFSEVTTLFPALLAKTNFGLDHATLADVAAIICEDEACLAPIANAANETTGEPRWIALALIHALWRKAGVDPQVMSSVLKAAGDSGIARSGYVFPGECGRRRERSIHVLSTCRRPLDPRCWSR